MPPLDSSPATSALSGPASSVLIERRVFVRALRGCSSSGRQGALSDGAWHDIHAEPASWAEGPTCSVPELLARGVGGGAGSEDSGLEWPLQVLLSNGRIYGADLVICAVGVSPNIGFMPRRRPVGASAALSLLSAAPVDAAAAAGAPAPFLVLQGRRRAPDAAAPDRGGRGDGGALDSVLEGAVGGLLVNHRMQTTGHPDVFAAGDAAAVVWPCAQVQAAATAAAASRAAAAGFADASAGGGGGGGAAAEAEEASPPPLWSQMRLWGQARQQSIFAARSMARRLDALEESDGGTAFECFAHVTTIGGFKVVLLGAYNGQGLGRAYEEALRSGMAALSAKASAGAPASTPPPDAAAGAALLSCDVEVQLRITPGVEYAKVVIHRGRVVGAMLVGDTDLEETMENLIMNRLSVFAPEMAAEGGGSAKRVTLDLLDPTIDIEDYFD